MKSILFNTSLIGFLTLLFLMPQNANAQTGGLFDIFEYHNRPNGLFKKNKDYVPGNPIPSEGILLDGNRYKGLILLPFPDNDTLFVIAYREHEEGKSYVRKYNERYFYHLLLVNENTADSILYYNLSNSYQSNKLLRQEWLDNTLEAVGIKKRGKKYTSNWIYYKPKKKVVGSRGIPGSGSIGFEPFSYKVVQRCIQEQYNSSLNWSTMDIIAAMMLYNILRKSSASSNNKYWEDAHWWSLYR